jgi:hypothetical protein
VHVSGGLKPAVPLLKLPNEIINYMVYPISLVAGVTEQALHDFFKLSNEPNRVAFRTKAALLDIVRNKGTCDAMLKLTANVTWRNQGQGNFQPPFAGMRPSFAVAGDLIAAIVEPVDPDAKMKRGGSTTVCISLPYGEEYASAIKPDMNFTLQIASIIIADGLVLTVGNKSE